MPINAPGPDIMGQTKVNVFLVAMAIVPFLQNMFLKIGTGLYTVCIQYFIYIYIYMYVYIIFRQNFSDKKPFVSSEKQL